MVGTGMCGRCVEGATVGALARRPSCCIDDGDKTPEPVAASIVSVSSRSSGTGQEETYGAGVLSRS
jgi:hypothetical protein